MSSDPDRIAVPTNGERPHPVPEADCRRRGAGSRRSHCG